MLTLKFLLLYFFSFFSYEHPYLLADNRHYPFYVWKNVFRYHSAVKYLLVPVYSVTILLLLFTLCEWILIECYDCMCNYILGKLAARIFT